MAVTCAWCGKTLRRGSGAALASHGICQRCVAIVESGLVKRWATPAGGVRRGSPGVAPTLPLPGFDLADGVPLAPAIPAP